MTTQLEFKGQTYKNPEEIASLMKEFGCLYERWCVRGSIQNDADVLTAYEPEIDALSRTRGYASADLVSLRASTPNLETICAKFDKEHHHSDDEVRFVVEGEGVFELDSQNPDRDFARITTVAGDLIVIPAMRRHAFYLTSKKNIRCIRLFKDTKGWEAIYELPS